MFGDRNLERRIDLLNYKLDLIIKHLGIQDADAVVLNKSSGSYSVDLTEVGELMAQGKKIQAIKRYRELTGLGLKDAKDAVETRWR
ncbi:ribosomal protein bL12 [Nocardia arthritidis]|uniref:Large ribosomal subunit protein bL12 C-terminal domain-containing protein n=1 Tax=Nocardia arthritidis TaxID=228602 RepID=A0A6G9YA89_9NOCA|nr:50S ribosomal protein L7/L12 [Nocardia arthritidis]QIS10185.1 hypothetical protein F5544_11465 [Nocardia arthritidis]